MNYFIINLKKLSILLVSLSIIFSCNTEDKNAERQQDEEAIIIDGDMDEEQAEEMTSEEQNDPVDNNGDDEMAEDTADIYLSETISIDESKEFVTFQLSAAEYEIYKNQEGTLRDLTNKIYKYFNDDYDFILFLGVEEEHPAGTAFGFTSTAKNEIEGLGSTTFNITSSFGSDGKLIGAIFYAFDKIH